MKSSNPKIFQIMVLFFSIVQWYCFVVSKLLLFRSRCNSVILYSTCIKSLECVPYLLGVGTCTCKQIKMCRWCLGMNWPFGRSTSSCQCLSSINVGTACLCCLHSSSVLVNTYQLLDMRLFILIEIKASLYANQSDEYVVNFYIIQIHLCVLLHVHTYA